MADINDFDINLADIVGEEIASKAFIGNDFPKAPPFEYNFANKGPLEAVYHFLDGLLYSIQRQVPMNTFGDFIESVTWSEPFIIGLIIFQLVFFFLALFTRKYNVPQAILFIMTACLVFFSEIFNTWGANNWQRFATQNYFDSHGLFMIIFFAGPLLVTAHVIVISLCSRTAKLAIRTKQLKLRSEARDREASSAQNGSASITEKKNQ